MKATKGNKTYSISEQEKKRYLDAGYDIQDDTGKIIAYGRGKTVPYDEYMKVKNECEAAKAELEALKVSIALENMSVEELTAYASEKEIDIGKATTKEGILGKIREAEKQGE